MVASLDIESMIEVSRVSNDVRLSDLYIIYSTKPPTNRTKVARFRKKKRGLSVLLNRILKTILIENLSAMLQHSLGTLFRLT